MKKNHICAGFVFPSFSTNLVCSFLHFGRVFKTKTDITLMQHVAIMVGSQANWPNITVSFLFEQQLGNWRINMSPNILLLHLGFLPQ